MDIDDYYFHTKNRKQRKFEGSSKRKGNTLRSEHGRKHNRPQEVVTKTVKTTGAWDADRINSFCQNILQDGGLMEKTTGSISQHQISMKKKKRWELSKQIRSALLKQQPQDAELPNVSIVERVCPRISRWGNRGDVTRATYAVTIPSSESRKEGTMRTRHVIDKTSKSRYSHEVNLTGRSGNSLKRYGQSDDDEHAEVSYEFQYCCPEGRHPADHVSEGYGKMPNRRKNNYIMEIEDYYNGEIWQDDLSDEENLDPQSEDISNEEGEKCSRDMSYNLDVQVISAMSKKKSKKPKSRVDEQPVSDVAVGDGFSKKGKLVNLLESERMCDRQKSVNETLAPRTVSAFTVPKEKLQIFLSKHKFAKSGNVSFCNSVPVCFIFDLRPQPCNNIEHGHCYLLFETDYDPDGYDIDDIRLDEDRNDITIEVTVFCDDEKTVELLNDRLVKLSSENKLVGAAEECIIEKIITTTRESVQSYLPRQSKARQGLCTTAIRNPNVGKESEARRKCLSKIVSGMSQKIHTIHMQSYPSLDSLMKTGNSSDEDPDIDFDFEMIADSTPGEKCRLCEKNFQDTGISGMAIDQCRHWFCKKCWNLGITESTEFIARCLEPGCASVLNSSMKLLLLSYGRNPEIHMGHGSFGDEVVYECPISSCKGVVKTCTAVGQPSTLSCLCGITWCGKCGNDPHWPASCSAAEKQTLECNVMKGKLSLHTWKECPQCGLTTVKQIHDGKITCQRCDYQFNCWDCMKMHSDRTWKCYKGKWRLFVHSPYKDKNACTPETWGDVSRPTSVKPSEDFTRKYESISKHMETTGSDELDRKVKEKVASYLAVESLQDLENVINDLLLVRHQICYTIPWVWAELRHGASLNSKQAKYVRGLLKKMEELSSVMDWLLMERDYSSSDKLFPQAYQMNTLKGTAMLKQIAAAFTNLQHWRLYCD